MNREHLGDFDLYNRTTGKFETASIYKDISEKNISDFSKLWRPQFAAKLKSLTDAGDLTPEILRESGLQDFHWAWPEKAKLTGDGVLVGFAVECANATQALMLALPLGFAREKSQIGLPLTEVCLLATAPWNRRSITDTPLYKGAGRLLISAAISLSLSEEHCGRIGLHAMSGAETWYREDCGMTDLGFDEVKKMRYFEMTQAQALQFIT